MQDKNWKYDLQLHQLLLRLESIFSLTMLPRSIWSFRLLVSHKHVKEFQVQIDFIDVDFATLLLCYFEELRTRFLFDKLSKY